MLKSYEYPHLVRKFLRAMEEIGAYGEEKYREKSFTQNPVRYDRTSSDSIGTHISTHYAQYLRGELHDHFHTKRHQLAAIAFNAMMEFVLADLEREE
jgi:hypothetical protein